MKKIIFVLCVIGGLSFCFSASRMHAQETESTRQHLVDPGDTWAALAWRYGLDETALTAVHTHINQQREPTIGATLTLPDTGVERTGQLRRTNDGGLLATAVRQQINPWTIALQNDLPHPYHPLAYQPLFFAGGDAPPRDLPIGFETLELSQIPAYPGQAIGFRAQTSQPIFVTAQLNMRNFDLFSDGRYQLGLTGTGAFFAGGEPELVIQPEGSPLWSQPWLFAAQEWEYQQLTLTGTAAQIDQESIRQERERLFQIWSQVTPSPGWTRPFQLPIDSYLEVSSNYGAHRSYNGGPYSSYHEGVDFSAYGGTAVFAPAAGTVTLAEQLYVRGGAVIIDHGLGIYSGYYHLSEINVAPGQAVSPGDVIGGVGTTGLSTGNHLHWDLLINETWVDAAAWLEQDMACWILEGMGSSCEIGIEEN